MRETELANFKPQADNLALQAIEAEEGTLHRKAAKLFGVIEARPLSSALGG
jgi:hypothetical protein